MEELAPGLCRWTAPHPDWTPDEGGPDGWERDVGCVAWQADDALVLIDPLVPVEGELQQELWNELDALASRQTLPVAVLITVHYHERSAGHLLERYGKTLGARIYARAAAVERLGCPVTDPFEPADALPGGIRALEAQYEDEVVFWLPGVAALVPGDVLLGRDRGLRLCPASWVDGEERLEAVRASLRPLLELPVEMVLTSHGPPVLSGGRAALERALS